MVNQATVLAEELKQWRAEIVRANPAASVGKAISKVKIEAAREFGDNEELFNEIADELGTFHALE